MVEALRHYGQGSVHAMPASHLLGCPYCQPCSIDSASSESATSPPSTALLAGLSCGLAAGELAVGLRLMKCPSWLRSSADPSWRA